MKHVDLTSSNLKSVGYDPATRALEVIFHNGGHFTYADVPPEKHAELLAADSPGNYFHREIRSTHKAERVKPSAMTCAADAGARKATARNLR